MARFFRRDSSKFEDDGDASKSQPSQRSAALKPALTPTPESPAAAAAASAGSGSGGGGDGDMVLDVAEVR